MAFTWLHVSDFHISSSGFYDANLVLKSLIEYVKINHERSVWKPDLIFATGDIAGKGDMKVFQGRDNAPATIFFDALLNAAGLERKHLFIVPGNHDVDRLKNKGGLAKYLETQIDIDNYFESDLKLHFLKLNDFSSWYNYYYKENSRDFSLNSTCTLIPYEVNGIQINLLLINSTLFCDDTNKDIGKLCIGRSCLEPLIEKLAEERNNDNIKLALAVIHHPFYYLHQLESIALKDTLSSQVDILLQGHLHQTSVSFGELVELGAGAGYFNYATSKKAMYCQFDGKKIEVFPICFHDKSSLWNNDQDVFYKSSKLSRSFYIQRFQIPVRQNFDFIPETNGIANNEYEKQYIKLLISELDHVFPPAVQGFSPRVSEVFVSLHLSDIWHSDERFNNLNRSYFQELSVPGYYPEQVMKLAFKKNHLLLVIGDPGSGKTTLLQHYALSCIHKDHCKKHGFNEPVMVFYLKLRDLQKNDNGYVSLPENIFTWAKKFALAKRNIQSDTPEILETFIYKSLRLNNSLILLDGLDEISDLEERKDVCEWLKLIISDFPKAYFVITSRPTGFRAVDDIDIQAPFMRADILDFNLEQQKLFLQQWFTSFFLRKLSPATENIDLLEKIQKEKAIDKTDSIFRYLMRNENISLRQIAGSPLMLQIMAMLWTNDDDIFPESRAKLYKKAIDYFLGYQYKQKKRSPHLSIEDALRVLAPVALWMQEDLMSDDVDRCEFKAKIKVEIERLNQPLNLTVDDFCQGLIEHAGLFVEYGNTRYAFRHKSFREYMVSIQLINDSYNSISKLIIHFSDPWWEEPLRFFFSQVDQDCFNDFMHDFFATVSYDVIHMKQGLLQTIIEETPKENRKVNSLCNKLLDPNITSNIQLLILDCLKSCRNIEALPALEQFRTEILSKDHIDILMRVEDLIKEFCGKVFYHPAYNYIKGKPSLFLNSNEFDSKYILIEGGSYLYSKTGMIVNISDLYVSKYPVTNKLYRLFISSLQEGNVFNHSSVSLHVFGVVLRTIAKQNAWGSEFGKYLEEGQHDLAAFFRSSYDDNRKFGGEDQPVIGVSWYAAQAYCLWLSLSLSEDDTAMYRLPSEVEREWAAGGRQGINGVKVRDYPWSDKSVEPTTTLANYGMNVGHTTPVNRYPDGATPEGLYDMAGNVWEWCSDLDGFNRILRGGCWSYKLENCRSDYSNFNTPEYRNVDVGFRVVFVP